MSDNYLIFRELFHSVPMNYWEELEEEIEYLPRGEISNYPLIDAFSWEDSLNGYDFWNEVYDLSAELGMVPFED